MIKIFYDNKIFFNQKVGGISRYFNSLGLELIKNEIDFKIIAPIFKNTYLKDFPKSYIKGIFLSRYPKNLLFEKYSNLIVKRTVEKERPDILHNTFYDSLNLKLKNVKKVFTVVDLIHEKFPNLYNENLLKKKRENIYGYDHYICISNNTKKDLMDFYKIPKNKISVIYLGSDHMNKLKLTENNPIYCKPFLLFVGSRIKYKNFDTLIKVFKDSKKIKKDFKVVCFGGGKFTNYENKIFQDFDISRNFIYEEGNDLRLLNFYKQATALIYPSIYEGFGLPIVEAMGVGCPVVSSRTSSMQEICQDAAKLFDPKNADELLQILENLLYDNIELENLKKKGLLNSKKFTWNNCATETLGIYKKLK